MKHLIAVITSCFLLLTAWTQSIKIHHIGVGQGDATLILINNGSGMTASFLIDAGNSAKKGTAVFNVLKDYLGTGKHIDFIITSHLHSDHLGGMARLMDSLSKNNWTVSWIVDRAANNELAGSVDLCYDNGDVDDITNDDAPSVPSNQLVKTYAAAVKKVRHDFWINLKPGLDLMMPLQSKGFGGIANFIILTSNGMVSSDPNDLQQYDDYSGNAHNENDYSYSFLIEMAGFRYFTGGDIGGAPPYVDLETPLVNFFKKLNDAKFHFCSYKATHHGSPNSTNTAFVNYTKPTVTVVPSALRSFSGTQLPGKQTLDRINASSNNVYLFYTYMWTQGSSAWSGKVANYKDIILTIDQATFTNNKQFTVGSCDRDKTSLAVTSAVTNTTVTCTKH